MRRMRAVAIAVITAVGLGAISTATGDTVRDIVKGSAKNLFAGVGPTELSVDARSDANGDNPRGVVRGRGDLDGPGPMESFKVGGKVTCVRVEGNRAAIKYRLDQAEGSAEPFKDGGVQVFIEDNGRGEKDANNFDPPQPEGVFQADESRCDDPATRVYDEVDKGDYVVKDAD